MRPYDPDDSVRMAAGVLKSMQMAGYDYPVRKLRRSGDCRCVTLPLQVRRILDVKRGDWLVFDDTPWRGVVSVLKISDERYRSKRGEDRAGALLRARRVQGRKSMVFVNIPKVACEILSVDVGDFLMFGIAPGQDMVTLAALRGGGDSAGSRRTG